MRLENRNVSDGVTLHWHGVDVPNAEDGVAGVTQNAVPPGREHVYRFVAKDAGTYWYHSHQVSHEQVIGGLFGTLIVEPRAFAGSADLDVVAPVHTYDAYRTVAGRVGTYRVHAPPGTAVRIRVVDTDTGPLRTWVDGTRYRVLAVDGTDVHAPTPVGHRAVVVAAGGRADIGFITPRDGSAVRVGLGGDTAVVVGPRGAAAPQWSEPSRQLDLLGYGSPAALGFDPARPDRRFEYSIGRRPGFIDGRLGVFWSVNGHLFPDVPMFVVDKGDVVVMTISNRSGEVHPMHLHGHHAVVLSRNGVAATGSPWWFDSLDVATGESYRIAFVADNPGIWMDHCHNLPHVAQGLVTHLAYTGVSEPYRIGGANHNTPE